MKKVILSAIIGVFGVSANAQLFQETFDSEIPASWTIIDADGFTSVTAQAAWAAWAHYSTYQSAASSSWYDNSGTGPSDDWLITPGITIPGSGNFQLVFDAASHEASYLEEYEVLLSTTGTAMGDFTTNLLSVTNEPNSWNNHVISLPAAVLGSTIYIAFHHISMDESLLHIDNVTVQEVYPNDISLESLNVDRFVEAGMVTIAGQVKNVGADNITSFDITWDDGSGPNSQTFTTTITSGSTYNFSHSTQLNAVGGTWYDIDVTATLAGDGDVTNNDATTWVSAVTEKVDKNTIGEEKTGTWCGWCPRGAVALEDMEATAEFIGVAVHNGDPMTVTSYDSNIGLYVPGGYPGAGVDRVETGDPTDFPSMHAARVNEVSPASISVSATQSGSNIEITVSADFVGPIQAGDFRLGCIITEDNVTGTASGYAQANYYDGGGAGALDGAGHDWTTAGNPVPADEMEYDHVARALGGNAINGSSGTLPGTIAAGSTESHTYTIAVDPSWNLDNCHFVGFIADAESGEILNAASSSSYTGNVGIVNNETSFDVQLFPNPTSDISNLKLTIMEAGDVNITIYNAMGDLVYTNSNQQLEAGQYYFPIQVSDYAAGVYTIKTTVNEEIAVKKLFVK